MKKSILALFFLNIIISCNSQVNKKEYLGEWVEVKYKKNEFVIVKCGYEGGTLKVSENSIFEHRTMEDSNYKINNVENNNKENILFTGKNEKSYFKFAWVDKEKGIAKWQIVDSDSKTDKYFVIKTKSKWIKYIKGTDTDCITNEDVGDIVNDSFKIGNRNEIITIEDENCISLKNKKDEMILEKCFEGNIIQIRHVKGNFIPLTFINGQKSMDIDFYNINNNWISESIIYYSSNGNAQVKKTEQINVLLKEFDFDNVLNKLKNPKNKDNSSAFINIKNKEKLMQMDIYKIADILKANPITNDNITIYNDAAYYLIEGKNYNEARIILLDIVKFSPDRTVAYLNLADAEWGFDEKNDAKKSYQQYILLMKSQGKNLKKIPQRVYDRSK